MPFFKVNSIENGLKMNTIKKVRRTKKIIVSNVWTWENISSSFYCILKGIGQKNKYLIKILNTNKIIFPNFQVKIFDIIGVKVIVWCDFLWVYIENPYLGYYSKVFQGIFTGCHLLQWGGHWVAEFQQSLPKC